MDDSKKPVFFAKRDAKRIAEVVKRVENTPRGGIGPRAKPPVDTTVAFQLAKTGAGGIPARSGTTVGIADVTLYNVTEAGELVASTESNATQPARNFCGTAIAANTFVVISEGPHGWWVSAEDCA